EFLNDGEEFLSEIANETRKERFIFAELEENEQDLERLTNWLERIQRRDYVGAGLAGQAKEMLEHCKMVFDTFSAEIYRRAVDDSSTEDKPTPEESR
ncbi:MAG: chromate resistance protein ChrB, partial [Chloroflexi bacterium]|nr:chromate resistance protein ChrB [Chloroflexota bacterium]